MKPIIATNNGSAQDKGYTVREGRKGPIVDGSHNGLHLAIFPRDLVENDTAYEIHITAETADGNPDWSRDFNSTLIDISPADVEEAASMYMRRLKMGIKPEDMFRDQGEANEAAMREIYESMKKR